MCSLFKNEIHGLAADTINKIPGHLKSSWCVCIGETRADNSRLLSGPRYYRGAWGTHMSRRTNVESIYRRIIRLREEMSTEWHFIMDRCKSAFHCLDATASHWGSWDQACSLPPRWIQNTVMLQRECWWIAHECHRTFYLLKKNSYI